MIFVGARMSLDELALLSRGEHPSQVSAGSEDPSHQLDDEVEFVSPRVPGRMQRGAPKPPAGKSE